MSTGIIGDFLPMEKIAAGHQGGRGEAWQRRGCVPGRRPRHMTTDTSHKLASREILNWRHSHPHHRHGKGAGMIGPNMATMLGVILTDAALDAADAQRAAQDAVDDTFNCISVEGHMSTNDTVLLLANGAAAAAPLAGADLQTFQAALTASLHRTLPSRFPPTAKGPRI